MSRTRIKICGVTRAEDALVAAEAGADAIGLVFYEHSPRALRPESAREVIRNLPPFVTTVGLFVDADRDQVERVLGSVHLDLLQFHGGESAEYCGSFGRPWIKALRVAPDTDVAAAAREHESASAILLDTFSDSAAGGTGESFDWSLAPRPSSPDSSAGRSGVKALPPLVLAGGLSAANVGEAIAAVRPWAVDVSSGVESAPGIKDATKIREFVAAVRAADEG